MSAPTADPVIAPTAQSNSSAQTIWQVQVGGCLTGCDGTVQLQNAGQQDATLQPGTSAPTAAAGSTTSSIIQLQLGCQQYCFDGTDPIAPPPDAGAASGLVPGLAAIQQLLSNSVVLQQLLGGPAGLQQLLSDPGGLAQLLSTLIPAQPLLAGATTMTPTGLDPVPGADQNAVDQSSYQAQAGGPGTATQTQIAIQVNATGQGSPMLWADASGASGAAVNQALQGIWQLQIGCIFYCTRTEQVQQASQSDTLIVATSGDPDTVVAVVNSAVMRIWQLQIGCLFWCYATVQVQSAAADASVLTVPVIVPGGGSPSPVGGSPPGSAGTGGEADPSPSLGGLTSPPAPGTMAPPSPLTGAIGGPSGATGIRSAPGGDIGQRPPLSGGAPIALGQRVVVQTSSTQAGTGRLPVGVAGLGVLAAQGVPSLGAASGSRRDDASVVVVRAGRKPRVRPAVNPAAAPSHLGRLDLRSGGGISSEALSVALGGAAALLLAVVLMVVSVKATGRRI